MTDDQLGARVKTVGYNYSELLIDFTTFCGSATEMLIIEKTHLNN